MKTSEKDKDSIQAPALYNIEEVPDDRGGGKSRGLARLIKAGLQVPRGFVIVNPHLGIPDDFDSACASLGSGPVAVRSSALNEDGEELSCAGLYRTILNVTGCDSVRKAVFSCVESVKESRVASYRENMSDQGDAAMAVIVQTMIDPEYAGVLFTADPVTGMIDRIVIEAVSGIGESLVDGSSPSMRYDVDKVTGDIRASGPEGAVLSPAMLRDMAAQALLMEERMGMPMDLEWALDRKGDLFWLQMRPITALDHDITELDYVPGPGEFFTRANIGEMMPGAVTPLTLSVFGEAIDFCVRHFYSAVGALTGTRKKGRFVCSFSSHLFFNLNMMFTIAGRVLGSSKETIEQNLLGRLIKESPEAPIAPFPIRFVNLLRMGLYVLRSAPYMGKLEKISRSFDIDLSECNPRALYGTIDRSLPVLNWSYAWHLCVSTHSGIMNSILLEVLRKGGCDPGSLDSVLAGLLTDIEDLESADMLKGLEKMAGAMRADYDTASLFKSMDTADAALWLKGARSGVHGTSFAALLKRHGHRCIREAEFREKDWNEDPENLVATLRNFLSMEEVQGKRGNSGGSRDLFKDFPRMNRRAFVWALKRSRDGVWQREHAKSLVIKVQSKIKYAYRRLASLMVEAGYIPDADAVFFLTHKEIGLVLEKRGSGLVKRALKRRRRLPGQMRLHFPDVFKGVPVPDEASVNEGEAGMVLQGTPVSSGTARGTVRVVRTRDDARLLGPGEIMAASFTDIGWTPFYGIAGGLITEVGSSLSHGAVVAREYGLPMVTGIGNIFHVLSDGDMVEIDGRRGTVTILEKK